MKAREKRNCMGWGRDHRTDMEGKGKVGTREIEDGERAEVEWKIGSKNGIR